MQWQRHEVFLCQLFDSDVSCIGQRMRVGERDNEVVGHHDLGLDGGRNDVPSSERNVGVPAQKSLHGWLGEVLAREFEFDTRVL